jgi:hypothetical protein
LQMLANACKYLQMLASACSSSGIYIEDLIALTFMRHIDV